jgi:hypothetical protein
MKNKMSFNLGKSIFSIIATIHAYFQSIQHLIMKNEMSFNLGKSIFSIYATIHTYFQSIQHSIYPTFNLCDK